MNIPNKIPYLRVVTVIWAIYSLIWITLEGSMTYVLLMGISTTLLSAAYAVQRYFGGKQFSIARWLILATAVGTYIGLGCAGLSLFFMGIKTGLHAHGPEFTASEILFLIDRLPFWSLLGALTGLGLGLIAISLTQLVHDN